MAWAQKLLGDVANIKDQPLEAVERYQAGLAELQGHPCPTVEWKILSALARTHALLKHTRDSQQYRAAARQSLHNLARLDTGSGTGGTVQAVEGGAGFWKRKSAAQSLIRDLGALWKQRNRVNRNVCGGWQPAISP